ncbi:isoprenyl transferase [Carnobacterium divergens]|uniref:Isoprenyl transferase n=1 Tax=Carnobacterium divergens DSM 20623 TaxID=1449336 RepID=A0A0R2HNU2_CARDV|nr:isoprenyl transferase [Carnobacterium divergens]ANZ99804.1 isoprenyl transferase [Carnobacterium divergens]KRN54174.1 undecaprenyl diphosphate synthase [Carnobacterium divergens DSM 20623]TFI64094.1 isoprenyl transferase [Carnobacterium divergens]TFI64338.1 isoprenyl transferase [Carnobacterium divergens]TFI68828.1 isoprenyl transferase [Carnobacterium divergens]
MRSLFNRKGRKDSPTNEAPFQPSEAIPNHIAIIMDGNGRWAQKKFLPRVAGHREGMNTVKKITKHASKLGVKVLTLYAFSTENWKRPNDEVNFLMQLPVDFFDTFVPDLIEENVQVNVMGFIDELPPHTKKAVENAIRDTKDNTGMILNFALNYGSRSELLEATKKMAKKVQQNELTLEEIDEETFEKELMTASLGEFQEPDLLVRTSGEERISNFLLWQIAYSEFYFTRILWPDFSEEVLENAIGIYQKRNRRFGGL